MPASFRASHSSASVFVLIFILTSSFAALGQSSLGQSSLDEVHIVPRVSPPLQTGRSSYLDPSLDTHTPPIRKDVDLVLVPVTITDPMGRLVTGLEKDNFQVFEGKQAQQIRHFSSEDVPISVGIILDMSGSMKDKWNRAWQAVLAFCETANPQDEFFLITFSNKPQLALDFTTRVEDIQNHLVFTSTKGRTALLDAIYLGVDKMRQAKYPKKALLIISDGGDNRSRYTENEIKSVVRESDVLIYAVGTYDHYVSTEEELRGPELLSEIASETGGRAFVLDDPGDMPAVANQIGKELRNQYVLGYRPAKTPHDGKWHKIKVKVKRLKGWPLFQISAKHGYYASSR
jgi:Ca-activated chloride channel family protein